MAWQIESTCREPEPDYTKVWLEARSGWIMMLTYELMQPAGRIG